MATSSVIANPNKRWGANSLLLSSRYPYPWWHEERMASTSFFWYETMDQSRLIISISVSTAIDRDTWNMKTCFRIWYMEGIIKKYFCM